MVEQFSLIQLERVLKRILEMHLLACIIMNTQIAQKQTIRHAQIRLHSTINRSINKQYNDRGDVSLSLRDVYCFKRRGAAQENWSDS